jgi:hypothetical protein
MYRLSGIAHLAPLKETYFKAPIDRNKACIGLTEDSTGLVKYDSEKVDWWTETDINILHRPVDWREIACGSRLMLVIDPEAC